MSISQAEFDRRKAAGSIVTEAPPDDPQTFENRRTGEISQVPAGVQPGFDYNPGIARATRLRQIAAEKIDALPAPLRRAALSPVIGEDVSTEFGAEVGAAFGSLAAGALQSLLASGYEVKVVDKIVNAAPELAGNVDYERIDGLTRFPNRQILIAELARDSITGDWLAALPGRGATVLAHEAGHALDEIHRLSEIASVAAAWRRESAVLANYLPGATGGIGDEISYFTQPWPRGVLETVAELYALRYGAGTATFLDMAAAFPETRTALEAALVDKDL